MSASTHPATPEQKAALTRMSESDLDASDLAGEPIRQVLTKAPENDAPIGGLKVTTENGWFAARPSGHRRRVQDLRGELRGP